MMDFEKVEFNKAISLNPKTQREEIKSQYPLVKLKICGDFSWEEHHQEKI